MVYKPVFMVFEIFLSFGLTTRVDFKLTSILMLLVNKNGYYFIKIKVGGWLTSLIILQAEH